jgi:uncharacterized membrane protein
LAAEEEIVVFLRETITWKVGLGVGLIVAGALLTIAG